MKYLLMIFVLCVAISCSDDPDPPKPTPTPTPTFTSANPHYGVCTFKGETPVSHCEGLNNTDRKYSCACYGDKRHGEWKQHCHTGATKAEARAKCRK